MVMTQTELANEWGVSQPYVAKLVKKGLPLTSKVDADRWRLESKQRPSKKVLIEPTEATIEAAQPDFARVAGVELVDEVKRLAQLASDISSRIDITKPGERSSLISDYTKVIDQLRKLRSDRPDIEEKEGKMVPIDEADKILAARDNALIPLLKGMAKRLAPICANRPASEVQTEVENEVGQIMRQVEAAL
jgi:hypothetical protein